MAKLKITKKDKQQSARHNIENLILSNKNLTKELGWSQVLFKGKQILLLKGHPLCCSWNPNTKLAQVLRTYRIHYAIILYIYRCQKVQIRTGARSYMINIITKLNTLTNHECLTWHLLYTTLLIKSHTRPMGFWRRTGIQY